MKSKEEYWNYFKNLNEVDYHKNFFAVSEVFLSQSLNINKTPRTEIFCDKPTKLI